MMSENYNPKKYWEERLSRNFNLRGVGHHSFSDDYNTWLYRRKRKCLELCLRSTSIKGKDVLDIGCGTGFFVEWYLQKGANVCGIDITEFSINELKKRFSCDLLVKDITAGNYILSHRYDIVNMWDVFYHIVDYDRFKQAVYNISSSLKSDGLFMFTDQLGASSDVRLADHVQMRCLNTYTQILPQHGFELVNLFPLYNTLNRTNIKSLDNHLGWLYFALDNVVKKIPKDNLSLSLWRKKH